jgi:hypothetical protein
MIQESVTKWFMPGIRKHSGARNTDFRSNYSILLFDFIVLKYSKWPASSYGLHL